MWTYYGIIVRLSLQDKGACIAERGEDGELIPFRLEKKVSPMLEAFLRVLILRYFEGLNLEPANADAIMSQMASFMVAIKAERRNVESLDRAHAIFERSLVSCIAVRPPQQPSS